MRYGARMINAGKDFALKIATEPLHDYYFTIAGTGRRDRLLVYSLQSTRRGDDRLVHVFII